jgi:hypothetical protein
MSNRCVYLWCVEGIHLVTKMNVCYIVCGVLINEQDDILMMQEAKPSCCGQWYLPAGRMEVNETIEVCILLLLRLLLKSCLQTVQTSSQ